MVARGAVSLRYLILQVANCIMQATRDPANLKSFNDPRTILEKGKVAEKQEDS